jgi:2-keto-4-pentenoate hydratase/2-oxohepta-3-ene-1,7-dioic acid hydratase in catechol pathway
VHCFVHSEASTGTMPGEGGGLVIPSRHGNPEKRPTSLLQGAFFSSDAIGSVSREEKKAMRLVSYGSKWDERAGILTEDGIVDLEGAMRKSGVGVPTADIRLLLEQPDWRRLLDKAYASRGSIKPIDARSVRLGAPVPVPRQMLIAGANTKSHIAEAHPVLKDVAPPREPMILAKATSSLCGPFDDVIHPPETKKLDYEVELGVVIGRRCRRISESEVRDHIAGYMTVNEMSARDIQLAEHESNPFYRVHFLGKSFDTFCPTGPALVTADEIEWGRPLKMRTEVNGEVRQDSDTSDLYFGIATLVAYCTRAVTLFPGDIIVTGSPAGVGFFMKPPGFLKPGDRVCCEIESVGRIENVVRAE